MQRCHVNIITCSEMCGLVWLSLLNKTIYDYHSSNHTSIDMMHTPHVLRAMADMFASIHA